MNNFIKNIPPLTAEQIAELDALKNRKIDLSDIPEITHEEFLRAFARKRAKLQKNNLQLAS